MRQAAADLIRSFWAAAPGGGHFRGACPDPRPGNVGCLWEQGQAYHALHAYWRVTADADAHERLVQNWRWMAVHHPLPEWGTCGRGTAMNYASDDTAWNAGTALDAYDVLREPLILQAARAALDCAHRRWHTGEWGGGYWYSDEHTSKSLYQSVLVLDCLRYFEATHDRSYLDRAIEDEAWIAGHLMITDASNSLPQGNGLYWSDYTSDGAGGAPGPRGAPFRDGQVRMASSFTFLGGNLAQAVVDAKLYAITQDAQYRARAVATAHAIREVETTQGVLLNDRDAWVDGWAALDFVLHVLPLLSPDERAAWQQLFVATASSIFAHDRTPEGRYGGDWQGPVDGVWTRHGLTPDQVMVNAQALNVIVAAAHLSK